MNGDYLMYRNQSTVSVGTSDQLFMGPNRRRRMLIISPPVLPSGAYTNEGAAVANANAAVAGVVASYTVPAGVTAKIGPCTFVADIATGVVSALQVVRAAVTYNLGSYTTNGYYAGGFQLQAGDVVQWNVITPIATATADYTIAVDYSAMDARVTLSFSGPAILDYGINLYSGNPPLTLLPEGVAQGVVEEIRCIASVSGLLVSVVELSYG